MSQTAAHGPRRCRCQGWRRRRPFMMGPRNLAAGPHFPRQEGADVAPLMTLGDDRPVRPMAGRFPGGLGARQGRPAIVRRRLFVSAPKDNARIADDVVRAAPDRFGQETIAHEICRKPDPTDAKDGCRGSNPKGAGRAERARCRCCAADADHGRPGFLVDAADAAPIGPQSPPAPGGRPHRDRGDSAPGRPRNPGTGPVGQAPPGSISEIRFEGNATIPAEKIRPKLLSQVGQPPDQEKFNADLKSCWETNWFSDVQVFYDESPPRAGS